MTNVTHTFTIEQDGKTFQCTSEIKGNVAVKQTVFVEGFGSRADAATYGKTKHSAAMMKNVAKRIAFEIIQNLQSNL